MTDPDTRVVDVGGLLERAAHEMSRRRMDPGRLELAERIQFYIGLVVGFATRGDATALVTRVHAFDKVGLFDLAAFLEAFVDRLESMAPPHEPNGQP